MPFKDKNIMIYKYVFDVNAFDFYRHHLISKEFVFEPDLLQDVQRNEDLQITS